MARKEHKDTPWAVALTKCYFCLQAGDIIVPRLLNRKVASDVESMHGKVVSMNPCSQCRSHMKQGIIVLTIDSAKSGKDWDKNPIPNPYRTGGYFVVKEEAIRRIFNDDGGALSFALKNRWVFMEHEAAEILGFFKLTNEEKGCEMGCDETETPCSDCHVHGVVRDP